MNSNIDINHQSIVLRRVIEKNKDLIQERINVLKNYVESISHENRNINCFIESLEDNVNRAKALEIILDLVIEMAPKKGDVAEDESEINFFYSAYRGALSLSKVIKID